MSSTDSIFVSQNGYVKEIVNKFGIDDCNPVENPVDYGLELKKTRIVNIDLSYFKTLEES